MFQSRPLLGPGPRAVSWLATSRLDWEMLTGLLTWYLENILLCLVIPRGLRGATSGSLRSFLPYTLLSLIPFVLLLCTLCSCEPQTRVHCCTNRGRTKDNHSVARHVPSFSLLEPTQRLRDRTTCRRLGSGRLRCDPQIRRPPAGAPRPRWSAHLGPSPRGYHLLHNHRALCAPRRSHATPRLVLLSARSLPPIGR